MPSDLAPVRSLARELNAVEDREAWNVLRETQQAWQEGYERRESRVRALT